MIKLIKILGSSTNVPEPVKFPINRYTPYHRGSLFYADNGQLTNYPTAGDQRKFIVLENLPEDNEKSYVYGFFVTDNMVFEIDYRNPKNHVNPGTTLSLIELNTGEGFCAVEDGDTEDALVIEDNNTPVSGKVIAVLKW